MLGIVCLSPRITDQLGIPVSHWANIHTAQFCSHCLLIGCCQFSPMVYRPGLRKYHSIVQNDIEQRFMNLDASVVLNKS